MTRVKCHHVPISSKKAQTGRADLIAEYVDLQSFKFFLRIFDQARFPLVNDPPFLDVTSDVGLLQVQGHVEHFTIYRGREAKTVQVSSSLQTYGF